MATRSCLEALSLDEFQRPCVHDRKRGTVRVDVRSPPSRRPPCTDVSVSERSLSGHARGDRHVVGCEWKIDDEDAAFSGHVLNVDIATLRPNGLARNR